MSTRANIAIFLKEEDRFKPLNFNDIRFDNVRPKLHANNLQLNFSDVYCNETETTDNYVLEIYNHHCRNSINFGFSLVADKFSLVILIISQKCLFLE
jgi:hypothetical protein